MRACSRHINRAACATCEDELIPALEREVAELRESDAKYAELVNELNKAMRKLRSRVAKVPHLDRDDDNGPWRFIGPMSHGKDSGHNTVACAAYGGRCTFDALIDDGKPTTTNCDSDSVRLVDRCGGV